MSDDPREVIGPVLWEEAKGKLRAFVAVKGSYPCTTSMDGYEAVRLAVESFIKNFEDTGLAE